MARRFYVTMSHTLPEETRDVRKKLRYASTWRDGKRGGPDEWATGSVELTTSEVAKVEAASNVLYVEDIEGVTLPNNVDATIPSDTDLQSHKMDMLHEWGFTGAGIDVGIIDDGFPSALRGKFNIKAMRREPAVGGGSPSENYHGGAVASLAVPRNARLAYSDAGLGGSVSLEGVVSGIYWLVDEVGVHILSTSSGGVGYGPYQAHADAIAHARSKGVTVISSAGNDGSSSPSYPSSYEGVIGVGALDRAAGWKRWAGSNYGAYVDLWMNGVNVASYGSSGEVIGVTGTSFSAPLATYVKASLLTKGLNSIGQIATNAAVSRGGDLIPAGLGGGRRVNGEKGAWAMRDFCG